MEQTVQTREVLLNGKWKLRLPEHRADRAEWGTGWEVAKLDSMHRNVGPGDVVWDIGSEEADMSALYQSWVGKGDGGVVLMEPGDRVWPNAKVIFEANNLKMPIACYIGFAGNEDHNATDGLNIGRWPDCADGPVIGDHGFCQLNERPDIPAIKIDSLAATIGPPSVLAIDVEGSEYHVLVGAHEVLLKHLPLVYLSIHPTFMQEQYHVQPQEIHDLMSAYGYREKHLETTHEEFWCFFHPHGRELRF